MERPLFEVTRKTVLCWRER